MKRAILILTPLIIQLGCAAGFEANYDIHLTNVLGPGNSSSSKAETWVEKKNESVYNNYENNELKIRITIWSIGIICDIYNKMDNPIKIIRTGIYYIDQNGIKQNVISQWSGFEDRLKPEEPFELKARDSFGDWFLPVDYLTKHDVNGWRCRPFLPDFKRERSKLKQSAEYLVGENLGFVLTLEVEGVERVYNFTFEIKDVNIVGVK